MPDECYKYHSFVKIIEENLHNKQRMVNNINKYAEKIKTSIVTK